MGKTPENTLNERSPAMAKVQTFQGVTYPGTLRVGITSCLAPGCSPNVPRILKNSRHNWLGLGTAQLLSGIHRAPPDPLKIVPNDPSSDRQTLGRNMSMKGSPSLPGRLLRGAWEPRGFFPAPLQVGYRHNEQIHHIRCVCVCICAWK